MFFSSIYLFIYAVCVIIEYYSTYEILIPIRKINYHWIMQVGLD
jgi:hypothetical protein